MPEWLGDGEVIFLIGLATGLAFGIFGQQSEFCLRAATIEFWTVRPGPRPAVGLPAVSAALLATQYQLFSAVNC